MDTVKILITDYLGNVISSDNQYSDYSFNFDSNNICSSFSLTLVNVDFSVVPGNLVLLLINNNLEFTGIIQRKQRTTSKGSDTVTLSGKDRACILVESYCNNFKDFVRKTPRFIVDSLIGQTEFYTKPKGSVDQIADTTGLSSSEDVSDRNAAALADVNNANTVPSPDYVTTYDESFYNLPAKTSFKINVGDMVFDKINQLVKALGFEVLYENSGSLYIGDLNKKRYYDPVEYSITYRRDGVGNNILSSDFTDDISGRYSSIMVSSQSSGADDTPINSFKTAKDSTVPNIKFMAMQINDENESAGITAIQEREDQHIDGFSLSYTLQGHTVDSGEPWKINRYAHVYDDINDIQQVLVVYSVAFSFSMSSGTTTEIILGKEKIFTELEI